MATGVNIWQPLHSSRISYVIEAWTSGVVDERVKKSGLIKEIWGEVQKSTRSIDQPML